jgi:zinc transport system substrate-binding protein
MKKILLSVMVFALAACSEKDPVNQQSEEARGKPIVITSNYPLYFFTSEIAGDVVDVRFPAIEGDPAMWAPDGQNVSDLQTADLLILNGAGYESWLAFTTLPAGHMLDTTAGVQEMLLPIENEAVHQHGPTGEHSHQGTAFTTWLDPQLAIEQARAIMLGLSVLVPQQTGLFESNFEKLEQRLLDLDQSLSRVFTELGSQPLIFSHPVYQYLQHRYVISGRSTHWEPDTEPGTKGWIDFGNLLRGHPAKVMVWEDSPITSVRTTLEQMGLEVIVFRPVGNRPAEGDYFTVMEDNLLELSAVAGR